MPTKERQTPGPISLKITKFQSFGLLQHFQILLVANQIEWEI